jgi:tripartite-type tricarboxylate transporter receptor subunit TctC
VLLNLAMGADVTHIPFKGAGPAMQAVIGGHVDYMCDTIQTGAIQVKNQTVKGLAVMSSRRVPIIDLATTGEQGLPRTDATVWNAFFFPRNTPDALVRRMNRVLSDTVDNPGVRKRLEDVGLEIVPTERRSPEYLAKFVPEEIERWARVVKAAGITPE